MYASTGNGTDEWDTSASSSAAISNAAFAKSNERAVPSFLKGFESFPISFTKLHRDTYNNANKSKSPYKNSPKNPAFLHHALEDAPQLSTPKKREK
jgi:hypothetical protein